MSRSNYAEDGDEEWSAICWRGAVASALRGRRGQDFLREMLSALDALPKKELLEGVIICSEGVCAMGAVALSSGMDTSRIDAEDGHGVASAFGIAEAMAREIAYVNDEENSSRYETGAERWLRVRRWIVGQIIIRSDELEVPKLP